MGHSAPHFIALATASVLAAAALTATQSHPATAEPVRSASAGAISQSDWQRLDSAIDTANETFDGSAAREAGVSQAVVDDFATGWSAAGREVTNATVDTVTVSMALAAEPRVRACVGKNSYDYTGLQLNAYMNSCNSAKFLGLITSGAGLATIAAVVTAATGVGAVVAGTIAGAMTVASGAVTTCTARGRGMVAHNIPPTVAVWCNNQ